MNTQRDLRRYYGKIITQLQRAGINLRDAGRINEALDCFFALADGDETFEAGDYAYHIGLCYEVLGETENAVQYFEIAVKNNPIVPSFREAAERMGVKLVPLTDAQKGVQLPL